VFASYTYTDARVADSEYYPGIAPLEVPRVFDHAVAIVAMRQFAKHIDLAMDFQAGSNYLYPVFYGYAYQFPGPRQLVISGGYSRSLGVRTTARFYCRVSNVLNQNYF
jgi:hypothetical protein